MQFGVPPDTTHLEQPCSVHCRLPAPIAPPCSAARVGWGFECLWFKMPARLVEVAQCRVTPSTTSLPIHTPPQHASALRPSQTLDGQTPPAQLTRARALSSSSSSAFPPSVGSAAPPPHCRSLSVRGRRCSGMSGPRRQTVRETCCLQVRVDSRVAMVSWTAHTHPLDVRMASLRRER